MFAHKCPHCGKITTYFDEEISYKDFGLEGKGTVTVYHCEHCGAVVTVMVPEKEEAEYDQVTISEDGTIDNQRKAAAKTDRHEDEKREKFLVILGADVDMEKVSKQGFINIKER